MVCHTGWSCAMPCIGEWITEVSHRAGKQDGQGPIQFAEVAVVSPFDRNWLFQWKPMTQLAAN